MSSSVEFSIQFLRHCLTPSSLGVINLYHGSRGLLQSVLTMLMNGLSKTTRYVLQDSCHVDPDLNAE